MKNPHIDDLACCWKSLEEGIRNDTVTAINIHRRPRHIRPYEVTFELVAEGKPKLIQLITQRSRQPRRWGKPDTLIRQLQAIAAPDALPRIFIAGAPW